VQLEPATPEGWSRSPRDTNEVFESDVIGVGPDGEYGLIGGRCTHCSRAVFPLRELCVHCLSPDSEPIPLCRDGAVYSYTVIHQAAPGFSVPYVLASVDLAAGVRLIGQVADPPGEVAIGTAVELKVEPTGEDSDGRRVIGFRFHVSNESHI
jgi:uncharacterized protein